MTEKEIEKYVELAQQLFRSGYNCSQAVFATLASLYGIDRNQALRLSASFGGGIGRMHSVCGAASGMFLAEGLRSGSAVQGDSEGKQRNYACVRQLAEAFKRQHGSMICGELLGLTPPANAAPLPKKTPCVEMVGNAVRIFLTNSETEKQIL